MDECELHLSLDFGQNNKCGNFSIRTEQQTNFIIKNNKIGINQTNPIATLDVSGSIVASGSIIANGPLILNNTLNVSVLSQGGPVYATTTGQLYIPSANQQQPTNMVPFHIIDSSAAIPFATSSVFIAKVGLDITLPPTNSITDGYSISIVNKANTSVAIISANNMFNEFYLPNGGTEFHLSANRKIELTFWQTVDGVDSWIFNTF